MAAFEKLRLDLQVVEREAQRNKAAALALYDQGNFVEQALLQVMGTQLHDINANPLKVN